ncbi:MAG: 50S ribosomal protein L18 [Nanoarchaeota archaeon]|nr:50S ribosomal protein L18 [Nanoarchaeota archaeon]MBU1004874.1 50S ribosomal protein L18 [Nanoarchaeota archaeon]MBU1946314.1 50S ribosomal protein L18 [Nanoarchaeota archaeon]
MRKNYSVGFKRKRMGKTDYRKRLAILSANKPRLVVRKSLNNILAQVVEYDEKGDRVIVSSHSAELKKYSWDKNCGNIPSAYLVGLLIGSKSKKKNIKEMILDLGSQKSIKGSRVYSLLKGCIDSGVVIPHSKEILPSGDRINGKHIKNFDTKKFEEVKTKVLGA